MTVSVYVNNKIYSRWTSVEIVRGLKRCVSTCQLATVGEFIPAIVPFQPCVVKDGDDVLLTGYVSRVRTRISAEGSQTIVQIKSKTQDLVDCMLLGVFPVNQFNNCTLEAIARLILAGAFETINLIIGPGVVTDPTNTLGKPFPDATFGSETAFAYLERLARQRAVMLTDDENGNLVFATAGTVRAPGSLVMGQGGNVYEADGDLNGEDRFSQYTVFSQAGILQTGSDVQVALIGKATDTSIPRFRPWAALAESALLPEHCSLRARWEAAHRSGEAVQAMLSVPEWRLGNPQTGPLWQVNQIARCTVPRLALNDDFLISEVRYQYDGQGKRTTLTVAPPSAFMPEPAAAVSGPGSNSAWAGVSKVVN